MMRAAETQSAFEMGVSRFSAFILKMVAVTVPLVFLLHALVTDSAVTAGEFLLFTIALTVSAIPEALPLVTTISLSRGALEFAKKHVVPRRLSAIEDLGSIDVLATDKTGTITENRLSVAGVYGERHSTFRYALMAPLARTGASAQDQAYDAAILASDGGQVRAELAGITLVDELPFDPMRKRATMLVRTNGRTLLVSRGAPERLYAGAPDETAALVWAAGEGQKGRRVLAVAFKEVPAEQRAVGPGGRTRPDTGRHHFLRRSTEADDTSRRAAGRAPRRAREDPHRRLEGSGRLGGRRDGAYRTTRRRCSSATSSSA